MGGETVSEGKQGRQNDDGILAEVITTALRVPGVKVNRDRFLGELFSKENPDTFARIIEKGPVKAGCEQSELRRIAKNLVNKRTLESSSASFVAGLPGGAAMAAAIPADVLQYYAVALRLAQEVSYLYGAEDLWSDHSIDQEKVTNTFIVYLGVMLGASGAAAALRATASALAAQAMRKLPQKALMNTIYYPIVKSIAKFFGQTMTKQIFAKGVSKTIPVVGGFASAGLTFATMRPMALRLVDSLDEALFEYTEEDLDGDLAEIREVIAAEMDAVEVETASETAACSVDFVEGEVSKAKAMVERGLITEEEFAQIKARLIAKL